MNTLSENPNTEIRMPKELRRSKSERISQALGTDSVLGFRASFGPRRSVFGFLALLSTFSLVANAQPFAVDWHTIDGGGGTSTGGVYSVSGTIGQPDASPTAMTGGNYSLTGGFWALYAVQTPGAPTLNIVPAGAGMAEISWTPDTGTNWALQETLSLAPTNWVNSASGSTNPIVVPANVPTKLYRLFKP